MKYEYKILIPSGNDTALVMGLEDNQEVRTKINDQIMKKFANVEQVGFVGLEKGTPRLTMAGGEFCGNALRCAAWYFLNGKKGTIDISVSGVEGLLKAGISENGEVWTTMPFDHSLKNITSNQKGYNLVKLDGIIHLVIEPSQSGEFLTKAKATNDFQGELKTIAKKLMADNDLLNEPACGVIFTENIGDAIKIHPCVRVKSVNSMFYETACGSGTIAIALANTYLTGKSSNMKILQPSGKSINSRIDVVDGKVQGGLISGQVETNEMIYKGEIEMQQPIKVRISKIGSLEQLNNEFDKLTELYQECFSVAPYFEKIEKNEVNETFGDYLKDGFVLLAHDVSDEKLVGFVARVPLSKDLDVFEIIKNHVPDWKNTYYAADLGVANSHRFLGLSTLLMNEAIKYVPTRYLVMRTQEKNVSSLIAHEKCGYKMLENVKQVKRCKRIDGTFEDDSRVFLLQDNQETLLADKKPESASSRIFELIRKTKKGFNTLPNIDIVL